MRQHAGRRRNITIFHLDIRSYAKRTLDVGQPPTGRTDRHPGEHDYVGLAQACPNKSTIARVGVKYGEALHCCVVFPSPLALEIPTHLCNTLSHCTSTGVIGVSLSKCHIVVNSGCLSGWCLSGVRLAYDCISKWKTRLRRLPACWTTPCTRQQAY